MRELPVLFNGQMVRAILEGRKTQMRRPLRNQPDSIRKSPFVPSGIETVHGYEIKPPYAVGDRMYVREAFQVYSYCQGEYGGHGEAGYPLERVGKNAPEQSYTIFYRADGQEDGPWRPSIHMPKWAARIWLTVTGVRVERLQDINEADAKAEGAKSIYEGLSYRPPWPPDAGHIDPFEALWDAQYGKTKYACKFNPWVSVTEFQRAKD